MQLSRFHAFPNLCQVLCVPALDTSVSEKHVSPFMQNNSLSLLLYPENYISVAAHPRWSL